MTFVLVVAAGLGMTLVAGCARQQEAAAPAASAPVVSATEAQTPCGPKPPATALDGEVTVSEYAGGCLKFAPDSIFVHIGKGLRWKAHPSLKHSVTIELPGVAFGDSAWTLRPGGSVVTPVGGAIGFFPYKVLEECKHAPAGEAMLRPAAGPGVDIGTGTQP